MKKAIGIISFLPNNPTIRKNRWLKLQQLLQKCDSLFKLPIIIIAQNWQDLCIDFPNVCIYNYDNPLGIVGARKELRKKFIESDFDYLIMLDDDCELWGASGVEYLRQIDQYPGCFIEFNKTLLKLFAISKDLFMKEDYEDINPEAGDGFEDRIFVNKLRVKYPQCRREFKNTGLQQHSLATKDPNSTWYTNQNISVMLKKTTEKINEFQQKNL